MILLAAAFELVPLLIVLGLAALCGLSASIALPRGSAILPNPWLLGAGLALVFGAFGFVLERSVRARRREGTPEWVSLLSLLGRRDGVRVEAVGGKALDVGRLAALGAPVPEGLVLTTRLVERIRAEAKRVGGIEGVWASLPQGARRELDAFRAAAKGQLIVRASFVSRTSEHSYAGVFPCVRDVDPMSPEALVAAVLTVVASADDDIAHSYQRRLRAPPYVSRAVIVQRQVEASLTGIVVSRGPMGVADSAIVDVTRKRSPVRSYRYDFVEGTAAALAGEELAETPAWMHRLAVLAVVLEKEFGGPVRLEFGIEDGQPALVDVRRVASTERKTWLHARPLDASPDRVTTFARELRGGLPLVRRTLSEMLVRARAPSEVKDEEVRVADGLVYYDAEVLRRALAQLGRDVLLEGGLRATLGSVAAVPRRPLPAVPSVMEITHDAWASLRAWHGRHLLGAAQVRFDLVARDWLVRTLLRLVDGTGSHVDDRRGHPALRFILARRLKEGAEEAERQRTVLEKAEAELGSAVARVLAKSAAAWNAMFKGDRHLHATLEEIDAWHADVGARDALENEWRTRGVAFDQRRSEAAVLRVHRPALPSSSDTTSVVKGRAPVVLRGLGLVPGTGSGPLVVLGSNKGGDTRGAVVAIADPGSDACTKVYPARGVVLLSGGLGSPVAELAAELGIPLILCSGARSAEMRDVVIDGAVGTLTVRG